MAPAIATARVEAVLMNWFTWMLVILAALVLIGLVREIVTPRRGGVGRGALRRRNGDAANYLQGVPTWLVPGPDEGRDRRR